jgi:predicted site-specific integrase-resolvase
MNNEKKFIPLRTVCNITGLNEQTVRGLFETNVLRGYKTPKGQRMFDNESVRIFCNISDKTDNETKKTNYIYTRVSSKKQSDDLVRQIEFLHSRREDYKSYITLSDIGSGINFKRKGIQTILDACLQKNIGEVVIAHRDRLCRFGFEIFNQLITKSGGKITVIDDEKNKSTEQELSEDLLAIVHIYSCRQMGRRKYSKTNKIQSTGDCDEINTRTKEVN